MTKRTPLIEGWGRRSRQVTQVKKNTDLFEEEEGGKGKPQGLLLYDVFLIRRF